MLDSDNSYMILLENNGSIFLNEENGYIFMFVVKKQQPDFNGNNNSFIIENYFSLMKVNHTILFRLRYSF